MTPRPLAVSNRPTIESVGSAGIGDCLPRSRRASRVAATVPRTSVGRSSDFALFIAELGGDGGMGFPGRHVFGCPAGHAVAVGPQPLDGLPDALLEGCA